MPLGRMVLQQRLWRQLHLNLLLMCESGGLNAVCDQLLFSDVEGKKEGYLCRGGFLCVCAGEICWV